MSIKSFDEVMKDIEDNDLDAFKAVWNAAIETCATIADDCGEQQIAHEYRTYNHADFKPLQRKSFQHY